MDSPQENHNKLHQAAGLKRSLQLIAQEEYRGKNGDKPLPEDE